MASCLSIPYLRLTKLDPKGHQILFNGSNYGPLVLVHNVRDGSHSLSVMQAHSRESIQPTGSVSSFHMFQRKLSTSGVVSTSKRVDFNSEHSLG